MTIDLILNNIDIATCIISEIDGKDTLASLARTSRALSHVALGRLWHTIENVTVLARCMPQEYWVEVDTKSIKDQTHNSYYQVDST